MSLKEFDKPLSTYDRIMNDPKRRFKFEQEYQKLLLIKILIPLLEACKVPVRTLAESAGVSLTVIQDIKSGKKEGISFSLFLSILKALGDHQRLLKQALNLDQEL